MRPTLHQNSDTKTIQIRNTTNINSTNHPEIINSRIDDFDGVVLLDNSIREICQNILIVTRISIKNKQESIPQS